MIDTALPPILGEQPTTLVLGSMPGQDSLKSQRYYAHKQNSFWWIMSEVLNFEISLGYQKRCSKLTKAGIAVWDVLHQCRRKGSLDSAIERKTEIPNDFFEFLERYTSIQSILFNGLAAEKLFCRHYPDEMKIRDIKCFSCPSTSPAYAAMTRQKKLQRWQESLAESINER